MIGRLIGLAVLALLGPGAPAQAAAPHDLVSGVLEIGGKSVPLPAGEWRLLAELVTPAAASIALVPLQSAALVRLEGGEVTGIVIVHTNTAPLANSLPAPTECRRDDMYLAQMLYETKTDAACLWANYMLGGAPGDGTDPVWSKAAAALDAPLPATWLIAGFWIGDRQDVLEVRYHFAAPLAEPEAPPARWSDSVWAPSRIAPRGAYDIAVHDLLQWIGAMAPFDQLGFYRRLSGYQPLATPWGGAANGRSSLKEWRLRQLQALRTTGTIDAAAYAAQRKVLEEDQEPPEPTEGNILTRALWKSATRAVAGSADTFVIAYLYFGSSVVAASYTIGAGVSFKLLYYVYEVAWQKLALQSDKRAVWKVLPIGPDS